MESTEKQSVPYKLQSLINEIMTTGNQPESVTEDSMNNILELMSSLSKPDINQECKTFLPKLEQCAVKLWNVAVAKKTGGQLSALLNAKYANDVTMCENPLSIASECIEKRVGLLLLDKEAAGGDSGSHNYINKKLEVDKDHFKLLCYKAELLCGQGQHDKALKLISQAKEMLHRLPLEGAYLSMLCYNFGVDSFQKGDHSASVKWLRESFELGKGNTTVGAKKQARTLRLLAHAYLEWDTKLHWQKALNAIGLANAEHPHPAGLYLKVRILLEGKEEDDRLRNGMEDVLKHPELTLDLGLNTIKMIMEYGRSDVACAGLKQLSQKYENTPHAGQIAVAHLELLIQAKRLAEAQDMVESLITGEHTSQQLDLNTKKTVHLIVWDQADSASQKGDHTMALQWYNYSLSLYKNQELEDKNLAKLHRNRASCLMELGKIQEGEEALSKAETCDPRSPFTYYIKYKMAIVKSQDEAAITALQKMCACVTEETSAKGQATMNGDRETSDLVYELICLAAQLALEKNKRKVSMHALESLVLHSHDNQQVLTALRCLVRLRLTFQEQDHHDNSEDLNHIKEYLKSAYEKLVHVSSLGKSMSINVQSEATWFMKIAWNMGLKCDDNYSAIQQFFVLCSKLQLICPVDLAALNRHKTCTLMAAAAGLQLAKVTNDEFNKRESLKQTLQYIDECREVIGKIEQRKLTEKDPQNMDTTTAVLLVLYEFEAKVHLGDQDLEHVLETALALPQCEAKAFETIAALSLDAPGEHRSLSTRALKVAIKKHLQVDSVDYPGCSKAFHSLIQLALQGGSHLDSANRHEAWAYYLDVVEIIENKAMGQYPEIEIIWLMTKAWNCGIHLFSATKYSDALQWCELAMKLLKHLGPLKVNYDKQMSQVYSEILAKADGNKEPSVMEH